MDDDLMALRGSVEDDDDDLFGGFDDDSSDSVFGGFEDPSDLEFDSNTLPATDQDSTPDWLSSLRPEGMEEPEPRVAVPPISSTPPQPKRPKESRKKMAPTGAFGLTPQQQMILSIFLFLDVAVLGFGILYGLGVIAF